MEKGLSIVEDKLHEALDEVATLKVEADKKVLRSKKQPPSKCKFDSEHYSTAATILTKRDYARLREVAAEQGQTVSEMLRRFVKTQIR